MCSRKLPLICFVLMTIISISSISYVMYVYFKAYEIVSLIDVSISDVTVQKETSNSPYVAIKTVICIVNPTDFALKVESVWEELYSDGWNNFLGENFFRVQYPSPLLPLNPRSNVTITITITNVQSNKILEQSPSTWLAKLYIWIYDVPLIYSARLVRYVSKSA